MLSRQMGSFILALLSSANRSSFYPSQNLSEAHFGLGKLEQVDRLVVTFPDGRFKERRQVAVNQTVIVHEDGR